MVDIEDEPFANKLAVEVLEDEPFAGKLAVEVLANVGRVATVGLVVIKVGVVAGQVVSEADDPVAEVDMDDEVIDDIACKLEYVS